MSSRAVRQARHSKNAWAQHIERVESCRVETWLAKWNLGYNGGCMLPIISTTTKSSTVTATEATSSAETTWALARPSCMIHNDSVTQTTFHMSVATFYVPAFWAHVGRSDVDIILPYCGRNKWYKVKWGHMTSDKKCYAYVTKINQ